MIVQVTDFKESLYDFYLKNVMNNSDYVLLNKIEFKEKLVDRSILFCYLEHDQIQGFVSMKKVEHIGYITILLGSDSISYNLLKHIEESSKKIGIEELWNHFFNPVTIPWYVLEKVTHPGKPGVPLDTTEFETYTRCGFSINSIQEIYYLNLEHFKIKNLLYPSKEITIDYYDKNKHTGYESFAEEMEAPHWKQVLLENKNKTKPLPMLVALEGYKVIGFAGPLAVEKSHRGYFAGIGILKEYRGKQIGKYLFNNLCMQLRNIGAKYMTLFTGETNSAKYIYKNAGFSVVKRFATMKKIL